MVMSGFPSRIVVLTSLLVATGCYEPRKDRLAEGTNPARAGAGGAGGRGGAPGGSGGSGPDALSGPSGDGPFMCQPGAPCALADNPCLVGETSCEGGSVSCIRTTRQQANGTVCGPDSVCAAGVCSPCRRGLECPIEGNACRTGTIECSSGKPVCEETGNAPNGAACGTGMVCKDGACAACVAGDACVPANPCHEGTLACAAGAATCTDTGRAKAAGTMCGPNRVCGPMGDCVACMAGMACEVPGKVCKLGKIDCTSGAPVCAEAGNAANGKDCGNGQVCNEGQCVACSAGTTCTPTNRCHLGTLACATGTPQCTDTNVNVSNGTMCGTNQYCNNGTCSPCTPNVACETGDPCKVGTTSCATGTSQCQASSNAPNGRSCGNGRVCNGGQCVACSPDMECQPSACKVGVTSCASGTSQCQERGNAPNGTSCGNGRVCNGGNCVSCNEGDGCSPGNPCKRGTISCRSGSPVCMESGNANDGTGCGGSRVCIGGSCRDCNPSSAPTCRNGQRVTCSSSGNEMVDNCGGNGCMGGQCNQCRPNSRDCQGTSVRTCRSNGSGYDTTQCPDKANGRPTCSGGNCSFECDSGYMKMGSTCVPQCGRAGQLCCGPNNGGPDDRCNSGLRCSGGTVGQRRCTADCGDEGEECCNDLVGCNGNGLTCMDNICVRG